MKQNSDISLFNLNVPCIVQVDDYHEFDRINSIIKKLNPKLKCTEIFQSEDKGVISYWGYLGIIYFGSKPNKKQIKQILQNHGYKKIYI